MAHIVPTHESTPDQTSGYAVVFGCVAVLILLGIAAAVGFGLLNSSGWVSRSKAVDLYVSGDWVRGEDRTCVGVQSRLPDEAPEVTALDCRIDGSAEDPHNQHQVEIRFYGKISRPDLLVRSASDSEWRCRRGGFGFTCYAMN